MRLWLELGQSMPMWLRIVLWQPSMAGPRKPARQQREALGGRSPSVLAMAASQAHGRPGHQ